MQRWFQKFPAVTVTWTPHESFAIPKLVISRKSFVNFSAMLNSDFISRELFRALLIVIFPVGVNHSDCLHSFCCCFRAAGTLDLRGHAAQLHRVSARWRWEKYIFFLKCCHSSFFTMSSKPDSSALKQIPERGVGTAGRRGGGRLPWLQSHPRGLGHVSNFLQFSFWRDEEIHMAETCQRRAF